MKKVLIAGSSGMIGGLVLEASLASDQVREVVVLVRKQLAVSNKKLKQIIIDDFVSYDNQLEAFKNLDAAYFCLGVYTGQVSDGLFKLIIVDYAVEFAKRVHTYSPKAKMCLLSGAGADRSEKSKTSFARYKGMAENQISALGMEFYSLRPGYIYPVAPREEPNFMYRISRLLYPILRLFGDGMSIRSDDLAKALFKIGLEGASTEVLENRDILNVLRK